MYSTVYIIYFVYKFSSHFEGCVLLGRSKPHEEQLSPKRVVIDVAEVLRRVKGFDEGPSKVKVPEANPLLDVYPNAFGKLDVTVVKFFIFSRHSNLELGTWMCLSWPEPWSSKRRRLSPRTSFKEGPASGRCTTLAVRCRGSRGIWGFVWVTSLWMYTRGSYTFLLFGVLATTRWN